jgi:hypothetical protein
MAEETFKTETRLGVKLNVALTAEEFEDWHDSR